MTAVVELCTDVATHLALYLNGHPSSLNSYQWPGSQELVALASCQLLNKLSPKATVRLCPKDRTWFVHINVDSSTATMLVETSKTMHASGCKARTTHLIHHNVGSDTRTAFSSPPERDPLAEVSFESCPALSSQAGQVSD